MNLYALIDYKGIFGSKHCADPYRSGMDKELLTKIFYANRINIQFVNFHEIDFDKNVYKGQYFLYTSSEDHGGHYKDYIEDILLGLELSGAQLIPSFKYFRAHNNKVFMEILRDLSKLGFIKNIHSSHFGTVEDLKYIVRDLPKNIVIKSAAGAVSRGVLLSKNHKDHVKTATRLSRVFQLKFELIDQIRFILHKGYKKESLYRKKIVIQNYVEGLSEDWKVLVFGEKYYVLNRKVRKNDFRASGSGKLSFSYDLPNGLLDYAHLIYANFEVPNIGLDIAFDGKEYYLFEFQAVCFGTYTLDNSPFYYIRNSEEWKKIEGASILENEYVNSIVYFLNENKKLQV